LDKNISARNVYHLLIQIADRLEQQATPQAFGEANGVAGHLDVQNKTSKVDYITKSSIATDYFLKAGEKEGGYD
jgi:hypothetical protein